MKTARLQIKCLWIPVLIFFVLMISTPVRAVWNLSVDGDARSRFGSSEDHEMDIHLAGVSVRKTFSDHLGDRFTIFGLMEAEDNFSEVMLHEGYGQYKGPLGAWNITAGRFGLPWGLLPGFSASRLLYDTPHDRLLGMDVDSGIKVSGVLGALDYGLSITQGYGPHHTPHDRGYGLGVARIGFTPGYTEEFSVGASAAWGRSVVAHDNDNHAGMMDEDDAVLRALAGLDATLYLGRWLGRIEIGAGRVDHANMATAFTAVDFALLPKIDLNFSVNVVRYESEHQDEWFVGFTGKPTWFTLRGGYRYAGYNKPQHEVILQIYRLFSFAF